MRTSHCSSPFRFLHPLNAAELAVAAHLSPLEGQQFAFNAAVGPTISFLLLYSLTLINIVVAHQHLCHFSLLLLALLSPLP